MNARRSIRGRWCSMAILIVFAAAMLAASITPVMASPLISFISPTPDNGTTTANTSVEINVSITEANLEKVVYNPPFPQLTSLS